MPQAQPPSPPQPPIPSVFLVNPPPPPQAGSGPPRQAVALFDSITVSSLAAQRMVPQSLFFSPSSGTFFDSSNYPIPPPSTPTGAAAWLINVSVSFTLSACRQARHPVTPRKPRSVPFWHPAAAGLCVESVVRPLSVVTPCPTAAQGMIFDTDSGGNSRPGCRETADSKVLDDVAGAVCNPHSYLSPAEKVLRNGLVNLIELVNWTCISCPSGVTCPGDNYMCARPTSARSQARLPVFFSLRLISLLVGLWGFGRYTNLGSWRQPTDIMDPYSAITSATTYDCRAGICLGQDPEGWTYSVYHPNTSMRADANFIPPPQLCREGHSGVLCEVCEPGWAYQGSYCGVCDPTTNWTHWSGGRKLLFIAGGAILGFSMAFLIFFVPLVPQLHDLAADLVEKMSDPEAAVKSMFGAVTERAEDAGRAAEGLLKQVRAAKAQLEKLVALVAVDDDSSSANDVAPIIKIVITFLQLVISFATTFAVPWPKIFNSITGSLKARSTTDTPTPPITHFLHCPLKRRMYSP